MFIASFWGLLDRFSLSNFKLTLVCCVAVFKISGFINTNGENIKFI